MKFLYAALSLLATVAIAEDIKNIDFEQVNTDINAALQALTDLGKAGSNVQGLDLQTLDKASSALREALGDVKEYQRQGAQ